MPKASPRYTSFNAGEWSQLLYGRVDHGEYRTTVAVCENCIPTVQGPMTNRPGTTYVAAVKDSSKYTRIVSFEFSTTQAYIIEFGNTYCRFYRDNGQIESAPNTPYEIVSPYAEAHLDELKFTQSADVLYITHPSYAPRTLTRTGHTAWTLTELTFKDGPYLNVNTSTTTLTLSATTGSVTVTASAATFASTDVGRLIRFQSGGTTWGWLRITAYTSTTVVTATVERSPNAATASVTWRLGVWSATTGYPSCVTFYEDRLFFAGSTNYPQRVDGSNVSDYPNFAPSNDTGTVVDSNAVSFTLNSNDVNVIRWMIDDEKGLLIGTAGGEWILRPSSLAEALSATNVAAKRSTGYGSANIQCIRAGRAVIYVQTRGRKLRELAYIYEIDGFRSPDMTMFAEHITSGGVVDMAYQQEPYSIIWTVRNDGELLGLTYEKDQSVMGWHHHTIGGAFGAGGAVVESIATIPSADGTRDELWMVVKRTINSATVRYIEYMNKVWETGDALEDCVYLDSALQYSGAGTTTLSGLGHLEGQTVAVLVNGATHANKTVTSGSITLDRSATKATVGLPYNSDMQTLNIESGAADGTAQGKTKRIHRVGIRFNESVGCSIGPDADSLKVIPFRSSANLMDAATNLFTGDKTIEWNGGYEVEGRIYIRQSQPLPMTIVGVFPQLVTQDRG